MRQEGRLACMMICAGLCGCGGEDGGDIEFDGYFTGTLQPDGGLPTEAFLYVAQDGGFYISAVQKAMFAGEGTAEGASYSADSMGTSTNGLPFQNGSSSAAFTFNGSIGEGGGSLDGAYSGASESGTYHFQWNSAISTRKASMSLVSGFYRYPAAGPHLYTLSISNNGIFSLTSGSCAMSGEVRVLDHDWNYYEWKATATNCPDITGPIRGHGWTLSSEEIYLFGEQSDLPILLVGYRSGLSSARAGAAVPIP